jgi:hypothetical protein
MQIKVRFFLPKEYHKNKNADILAILDITKQRMFHVKHFLYWTTGNIITEPQKEGARAR